MLSVYPERKRRRRSRALGRIKWLSPTDYRFLLAGCIAVALMVLPWHASGSRHCSAAGMKRWRIPAHHQRLPGSSIRGNALFSNALLHMRTYGAAVKNTRYLTVIDYGKPSNYKRMYLLDLKTGRVEKFLVSHGRNSGCAYATDFSNRPESFKSCRGFFVTGRKYSGKHGIALQLYGLEKGVNDNAFRRGIVIHGAEYVSMRAIMLNRGRLGRSLGCPAISTAAAEAVIDRIKNGSLVYIHSGSQLTGFQGPRAPIKHRKLHS
jgi:hypothetical protein